MVAMDEQQSQQKQPQVLGRIRTLRQRVPGKQLHKRIGYHTVWQILQGFVGQQVSAEVACRWLEISKSRLYALAKRWKSIPWPKEVAPGWLYERPQKGSSRLPAEVQDFILEELRYIKEDSKYFKGHFNFAVLAQQCQKRFGKRYHRNTIRRWAVAQGMYSPEKDSTGKPCIRFETGGVGFLFQHDSSHHAWLPLTKRKDYLILTIDDHSRKVVGAKLTPRESAWHHLCVVRHTIETLGCPLAYYTDNHSIFTAQTETHTQFSRALHTVDVTLKLAQKGRPQAKGKVEKRFDYFQRRIPYLCERYNITSLTQANKILDEEVSVFNQEHIHAETKEIPDKRWQRAVEEGRTFLRSIPKGVSLDLTFALHYTRPVRSDGTIQFAGQSWTIPHPPRYRKVTVILRPPTSSHHPHTEIFVIYEGSTLAHFVLPKGQML